MPIKTSPHLYQPLPHPRPLHCRGYIDHKTLWCLLFYGPLIYKIKEFVESPSPKVKFKMGFYCSWRALGSSEEEFPDAEDVQLLE